MNYYIHIDNTCGKREAYYQEIKGQIAQFKNRSKFWWTFRKFAKNRYSLAFPIAVDVPFYASGFKEFFPRNLLDRR